MSTTTTTTDVAVIDLGLSDPERYALAACRRRLKLTPYRPGAYGSSRENEPRAYALVRGSAAVVRDGDVSFTDMEGSTSRWEADPEAMRAALVLHDEVLPVGNRGSWRFVVQTHRGRRLRDVWRRSEDYFGPVLNRTARVMAAGHGGQILVAASRAAVVSGVDLIDRGRLRDLSGVEHLYQVRGEGLQVEFSSLRTLDAIPGNLPVLSTSFVGRSTEVKDVIELVRAHRLVTLTGVGIIAGRRVARCAQ